MRVKRIDKMRIRFEWKILPDGKKERDSKPKREKERVSEKGQRDMTMRKTSTEEERDRKFWYIKWGKRQGRAEVERESFSREKERVSKKDRDGKSQRYDNEKDVIREIERKDRICWDIKWEKRQGRAEVE